MRNEKLEAELRQIIPLWEKENGKPFLVNGVRFIDSLDEKIEADLAEKEAKKVRYLLFHFPSISSPSISNDGSLTLSLWVKTNSNSFSERKTPSPPPPPPPQTPAQSLLNPLTPARLPPLSSAHRIRVIRRLFARRIRVIRLPRSNDRIRVILLDRLERREVGGRNWL